MADISFGRFDDGQKDYLRQTDHLVEGLLSPYACPDRAALRLYTRRYPAPATDPDSYLVRGPFAIDIDKIVHCNFYNRCTDKTQVFSFYRDEDITRRALHMQLVSRTARTIGRALRLNLDLIEAVALGHDMGHTPFGHAGEQVLNQISVEETGRYFNHNVHSVRVLKDILRTNLTLQTYDGIVCHNGERDFTSDYYPGECRSFDEFGRIYEECYTEKDRGDTLRPGTLEGCVVRISDILAYVGKDRQDAVRAGLCTTDDYPDNPVLGKNNIDILDNTIRNIIRNSIDRPCLAMDPEVARALMDIRRQNYELIYRSAEVRESQAQLEPIMWEVYHQCLADLKAGRTGAPVFLHHLDKYEIGRHYQQDGTTLEQQVIDYIAAMTDDYLVALHRHLFPRSERTQRIVYHSYFDDVVSEDAGLYQSSQASGVDSPAV